MSDTVNEPTPSGDLLLDAFGYHADEASAIRGLGGPVRATQPGYALHTAYVPVAEGPAHFTLRFEGLSAKIGTLQLRVHMFVEGPPARFLVANTVRIQFNRLIQLGNEVSVRFEGIRGVQFALHGAVLGETDAEATGITVTLDRPATGEDGDAPRGADLRNTEYGLSTTRETPMLLAVTEPTLAHPVSQLATVGQAREPDCAEWCARMGLTDAAPRAAWSAAYVLQVIRAYGLLQPGARALGYGAQADRIAAVLNEAGLRAETDTLPDLPERLPGERLDYDVLWSIDATAAAGVSEATGYVEGLMRCLRPGGLAVHVVPFMPGRRQDRSDPPADIFRRGEIERLAITMISRNAETAQLKIDGPDPLLGDTATGLADVGAFGLVMRKALLNHH